MPKLTKIAVGGFKSIKDLQSLDLRPVNVFIGANGSGKSNLVSFFKLLHRIADGTLQGFVGQAGGADTLLYYGAKETSALWARVDLKVKSGDANYFFWLSATATDSLVFSKERVIYPTTKNSPGIPKHLGSGHKESLLMEGENQYREIWDLLAGIQVFHFHDTSETAAIRKQGDINDNRYLRNDGGNLAAFLYALKQRKRNFYRRIVGTIRLVAPFFDDFVLAPSKANENYILLAWKDQDSDHLFGPHQLSDGTLRAMALIALLLQPEEELPAVVVLDEPEIGLHPHAIEILASLVCGASTHSVVVLATQSVSLVNCFEPEDIVVVSRSHSESRFERQNSESLQAWLKEYSIGELWEKNLIGGAPSR